MIIVALVFLLAGAAVRVSLLLSEFELRGDSALRYDPIARNLISGHGFSRSLKAPYVPDDFDQPIYPLILAAIFKVSNFSQFAVRFVQELLELATLWLVYLIAFRLRLPAKVGIGAVLIGMVCPFIPLFAGRLLTETLATFILTLTVYLLLIAKEQGGIWWLISGMCAGAGLLTRPDLLISLSLMATATVCMMAENWRARLTAASIVGLGVILIMMPWCYRNYMTFGELRPLGGVASQASLSYVKWLGTWVDDPKYQQDYWWKVWDRGKTISFPAEKLTAEQMSVASLALEIAGAQGSFEGEPDRIFEEAYSSAYQEDPLKVILWLPVKRTVMAWLRMPGYLENTELKYVVYALWALFLVLSAFGLAMLYRVNRAAFVVLGGWIAGRAVLPLISVLAIEPRYQIESLPACFIVASFGIFRIYKWSGLKLSTFTSR